MSLIIAIQTSHSIILAADTQYLTISDYETGQRQDTLRGCKLRLWKHGVLTGTGDAYVSQEALRALEQGVNLNELPATLNRIKHERFAQCGYHTQTENARVIVSRVEADAVQLYVIDSHHVMPLETNSIDILSPFTDQLLHASLDDFNALNQEIKDSTDFQHTKEWVKHYLRLLTPIYQKQSQYAHYVSPDFYVYIQTQSFKKMYYSEQEPPYHFT